VSGFDLVIDGTQCNNRLF